MGDTEMVQHAMDALGLLGIPRFATTDTDSRAQFNARMNLYTGSRGLDGSTNAQYLQRMLVEIQELYHYFQVMDSDKAKTAMNILFRGSYWIPEIPVMTAWYMSVGRLQRSQGLPVTYLFDAATQANLRNGILSDLATASYWLARMIQQETPVVSSVYSVYTAYGR